jgi:opacity protein-like surface antigen
MKKLILISSALAATAFATPAMAQEAPGEGRVEVRGGLATGGGFDEGFIGVAAGYDFDLGDAVFVGGEVSVDRVLVDGAAELFGLTGRIGANVGESTRIFAAGGRSFSSGEDVWHAGAGVEQKLSDRFYVKAEYRHFFSDFTDIDTFAVGGGIKF